MRRSLLPFVLPAFALFFACSELRVADEAADAGTGSEEPDADEADADDGAPDGAARAKDGGGKDASTPKDSGAKDSAPPPPTCDGPCPPEELATGLKQATALAVDANNIYFAVEGSPANGAVYQCPKTGCVGAPILLGGGYATGIVVAGGAVYWGDFFSGKVVSCAVGGCSNAPSAVVSNQPSIKGVFTDGVDLFWSTNGAIRRCPQATCSDATVAGIVTGQGLIVSIAAEQGKVLWASSGSIQSCAVGPCPSPIALGPGAADVSIHAGVAYWVTSSKTVVRCPLGGCNGKPLTVGSSQAPRVPVSDGTSVYWRDELFDQIYRCPAIGCTPGLEILAYGQRMQSGGQIALDGQYVYWTNTSGVYRLLK
jgi:hypothetical protein